MLVWSRRDDSRSRNERSLAVSDLQGCYWFSQFAIQHDSGKFFPFSILTDKKIFFPYFSRLRRNPVSATRVAAKLPQPSTWVPSLDASAFVLSMKRSNTWESGAKVQTVESPLDCGQAIDKGKSRLRRSRQRAVKFLCSELRKAWVDRSVFTHHHLQLPENENAAENIQDLVGAYL